VFRYPQSCKQFYPFYRKMKGFRSIIMKKKALKVKS